MTKSTKSHLRGFSILLKNSSRVHELVARAVRGECVRQRTEQKAVILPLSATSTIPRVRTYHTREPSRFVHALSARPLKVQGGRDSNMCADESKDFCQPSPVGEGGARSVTDEVSFVKKRLKNSLCLSYFSVTKSTKSQQGGLAPSSFRTSCGVHELVARAMRGE